MVVRFRKKNRKNRGNKTGWGAKKKHRGGGSQGGHGAAGMHKHKFSFVVSKEPEHYGYKGFFSRKEKIKAINVGDLEKMTDEKNVDLKKFGYSKLLSRGKVKRALNVSVASATERAMRKIEAAGGKVVVEGGKEGKEQSKTEEIKSES